MFTNKIVKKGLKLSAALFCFVFPALIIWWVGGGGNIKESLLTAVGKALLLTPFSLVAVVIIARVTREWKKLWKDLVLGIVGVSLFWLGFYEAFIANGYTLIGNAAGIAGAVLLAVALVLPQARKVVEETWE